MFYTLKSLINGSGKSREELDRNGIEITVDQFTNLVRDMQDTLSRLYSLRGSLGKPDFGQLSYEAKCGAYYPQHDWHQNTFSVNDCNLSVYLGNVTKVTVFYSHCDWVDIHLQFNDLSDVRVHRGSESTTEKMGTLLSIVLVPHDRDSINDYWESIDVESAVL